MKTKFINTYMDIAKTFSYLSSAKRLKVGAIIVKEDRIISIGYNGMPAGWSNECEYVGVDNVTGEPRLITKDEVIHAEANAIAKLARGTESGEGSVMFLTHSPCIQCAKQIYTAGIKQVYYRDKYSSEAGIEFLKKCNVEIKQWNIGDNTSS
jgi:dCMP deaminase